MRRTNRIITKRQKVNKPLLNRVFASTSSRGNMRTLPAYERSFGEPTESGSNMARALFIIFFIHIAAVALVFIHKRFLEGRSVMISNLIPKTQVEESKDKKEARAQTRTVIPSFTGNEEPYVAGAKDTYESIAREQRVDLESLRLANKNTPIRDGLIMKLPVRRALIPEAAATTDITPKARDKHKGGDLRARKIPKPSTTSTTLNTVENIPKAVPVGRETEKPAEGKSTPQASGIIHVVGGTETIWRIARMYKVRESDIMKMNNITDARKLHGGQKLIIPKKN